LLYEAAAAHGWLDVTMLLFASVLAGLALVRLAWERLLGPSEELPSPEPLRLGETELDRPLLRRLEPEPRSTALLTVVLLAVCLLIGLFPQPVMATIDRAIDGLAFIRVVDQ
jgi:formate hydrogenlyase subunit 3/multisubunit Na+/H+ antiporter MnhD subunit